MLDFKELAADGNDFELLIRELLFTLGFRTQWSGKGADGGKDLLFFEDLPSIFVPDTRTWLVQCKHFAHSGKAVSHKDLDQVVDSCTQHGARAYLLACSTHPSSGLVSRLEGIAKSTHSRIVAAYWDAVTIERLLRTPRCWHVAQRFFPQSAVGWQIFGTEWPNRWIAAYKGFRFHVANRIGSQLGHQLDSIERGVAQMTAIKLPEGQFIRLRAVYYDDKNGNYTWYIDYMYPDGTKPQLDRKALWKILDNGTAWDDGGVYYFDIVFRSYWKSSDHYDRDHYDYYQEFIGDSCWGSARSNNSDPYD